MEEILKILEDLKAEKYIKDGWLYDIDVTIKTEYSYTKDRKLTSNIIECINNCTSPTGNTDKDKLKSIFRAFSLFPMDKTRILILGQDPYPKSEKACGFAFMHKKNYSNIDASLKNIYKAIWARKETKSFDIAPKNINWNTCPLDWIFNNKVLLLNTALTYEETDLYRDTPEKTKRQKDEIKNKQNKLIKKHQAVWKTFIKNTIIKLLTCNSDKLVVFLWGADAQNLFLECINSFGINNCDYNLANKTDSNKRETINITRKLLCLTTSHPSNNGGAVYKGFSEDAPNHFKACDEFLGEDIWKNFPENNQKNT